MRFSAREDVLSITPLNPFDRFDDGRPKVPDDLIERMKLVTTEEAWEVLRKHIENQYSCQYPLPNGAGQPPRLRLNPNAKLLFHNPKYPAFMFRN